MTKEIIDNYKKHPRILELRLAVVHTLFTQEYGSEKTAHLFKTLCDISRINWTTISSIINRKDAVLLMSGKDRTRYRQEIVFMGTCFGENRIYIGKKYLGLSKRMMYEYKDRALDPNYFVNETWLDGLNYSVVLAGVDAYRIDLERFLEALDILSGVLGNVSVAKT